MNSKFAEAFLELFVNNKKLAPQLNATRSMVVDSLSRTAEIAGGILTAEIGRSLYDAVAGLPGLFIESNARLEQYTLSLGVMLKDQEKANDLIKDVERFAAKTPFNTDNLMSSVQLLKAYGFEVNQLLPMMETIGNAAAAAPQGMEYGVHRISLALGQMRSKGKVSAQEMLQLTEAGVAAWGILAEEVGMSMADVQEATRKGAIGSEQAIAALLKGMDKRFGGMMEKQSKGWNGLMSTLEDVGIILSRDLGEPFFELAKIELNNLVDWVQSPAAEAFVNSMVPTVRAFTVGMFDAIKAGVQFTQTNWELIKTFTAIALTVAKFAIALMALQGSLYVIAKLRLALTALSAHPLLLIIAVLGTLAAAFVESKIRGEDFIITLDRMTGGFFGLAAAADHYAAQLDAANQRGEEGVAVLTRLMGLQQKIAKSADEIYKKHFPDEKPAGPVDPATQSGQEIKQRASEEASAAMAPVLQDIAKVRDDAVALAKRMREQAVSAQEVINADGLMRAAIKNYNAAIEQQRATQEKLRLALEERYTKERAAAQAAGEFDARFEPGGDLYSDPVESDRADDAAAQSLAEGWAGVMQDVKDFIQVGVDNVAAAAQQVAEGADAMAQQAFEEWRQRMGIGDATLAAARDSQATKDQTNFMMGLARKMGLDPAILSDAVEQGTARGVKITGLADFHRDLQTSLLNRDKDAEQRRMARDINKIATEGIVVKKLPEGNQQAARFAP
jgi:tape measure domain-containing protein